MPDYDIGILGAFYNEMSNLDNFKSYRLCHLEDRYSDSQIFAKKVGCIISFGTSRILSEQITSTHLCVNLHGSMLPYTRGPNPGIWRWIMNEPHGASLHVMDRGIDSGPIIAQTKIENPDSSSLRNSNVQTVELGLALLNHHVDEIVASNFESCPQVGDFTYYSYADQKPFEDLLRTHNKVVLEDLLALIRSRLRNSNSK